ncbi:hypothetical protein ACTXT7_013943 [Hymenolepis weldensis]
MVVCFPILTTRLAPCYNKKQPTASLPVPNTLNLHDRENRAQTVKCKATSCMQMFAETKEFYCTNENISGSQTPLSKETFRDHFESFERQE